MGLLRDLFGDDDAAIAEGVWRKLEAIHTDVRRLTFIVTKQGKIFMADIDVLNAAIAAVQVDENTEDAVLTQIEGVGTALQASLTILEGEVAAGSPNLQPAIAAINALKAQNDQRLAKLQADLAAGGTLEGTLPQPAATTAPAASTTGAAPVAAAAETKPASS